MRPVFLIALFACSFAFADEGHPIAVRCWPDGGVTVETMWDLHVAVNLTANEESQLPRLPDISVLGKDTELKSRTHVWGTDSETFVLDRPANASAVTWQAASRATPSSNAVHVTKLAGGVLLKVDGVRILVGSKASATKAAKEERLDVWVADETAMPLTGVGFALTTASELPKLALDINHNTFAVSQYKGTADASIVVGLQPVPWKMPDELAELFERKDVSSKASRKEFAALSVDQMNFKPANGTHTPRWNTEHMMGRELLFFSQIYAAQNSQIPVMNLNPQQMPKDYKFAHADWTGEEESRQTARVTGFSRRFAYLLDGLNLDRKPPGSRIWTPRSLLLQLSLIHI